MQKVAQIKQQLLNLPYTTLSLHFHLNIKIKQLLAGKKSQISIKAIANFFPVNAKWISNCYFCYEKVKQNVMYMFLSNC